VRRRAQLARLVALRRQSASRVARGLPPGAPPAPRRIDRVSLFEVEYERVDPDVGRLDEVTA